MQRIMSDISLADTQIDPLNLPVPTSADEEKLIAYLDNEMSPYERQEFEDCLAKEPQLRAKLIELENSWKALDLLDVYGTNRNLVYSTMEQIAIKAENGISSLTGNTDSYTNRNKTILFCAAIMVCVLCGYFAVNSIFGKNQNDIYEDLPIIERLDQYMLLEDKKQSGIDEIEFLIKLNESKILD